MEKVRYLLSCKAKFRYQLVMIRTKSEQKLPCLSLNAYTMFSD